MEYLVRETARFSSWLERLKNVSAKITIARRIQRIKKGNFGDHKRIDTHLWELRFPQGAGYRVYYTVQENRVIILVNGGDKSTQQKDINTARILLKEIQDEEE